MKRITAVSGAGIAAVALTLTLAGCGSSTKTEEKTTATTSAQATSAAPSSAEPTSAAPPTSGDPQAAGGETLDDYIAKNGIQKTVIRRGEPGPTIDLPVPQGWSRTEPGDDDSFGGLIYDAAVSKDKPPRIRANLYKLTGNIDQAKVLELAPAALKSLPNFQPLGSPGDAELSGFKASQVGGSYVKNGDSWLVAQKTTVIPTDGGVFVFQLNAEGLESDMPVLMDGTSVIDKQTKITP
ncbi:MAG TPA: LpqN/LpqT family lipoprotein [Mycobacterium sp.]|nr:LpqN/LpqT family lipoprotein [Mycobacterium sp.]